MVAWLNKRILSYLRTRDGARPEYRVSVNAAGITVQTLDGKTIGAKVHPWHTIEEIFVLQQRGYAADIATMVMKVSAQEPLIFDETMEGWLELASGLEHRLPGSMPYTEWGTRLLSGGAAGAPISIFSVRTARF